MTRLLLTNIGYSFVTSMIEISIKQNEEVKQANRKLWKI